MELSKDQDGWTLSFNEGRIQLIQVDFRLNFLVTDGPAEAWLHVETRGTLKSGATEIPIIPAQSATLAPILALLNAVVSKITIAKTGQLAVAFEQDRMMFVPPDAAYEAWQLECSTENGDSRLVCPPGGDVAFFDDAIMPQRAGTLRLN